MVDTGNIKFSEYICDKCDGQGEISGRNRYSGSSTMINCRKCQGSGLFAIGPQVIAMQEEIERLKDRESNEIVHTTDYRETMIVKLTAVGIEVWSNTGNLHLIMIGDDRLAIALRPASMGKKESA